MVAAARDRAPLSERAAQCGPFYFAKSKKNSICHIDESLIDRTGDSAKTALLNRC
jgi:hypothetical protein